MQVVRTTAHSGWLGFGVGPGGLGYGIGDGVVHEISSGGHPSRGEFITRAPSKA